MTQHPGSAHDVTGEHTDRPARTRVPVRRVLVGGLAGNAVLGALGAVYALAADPSVPLHATVRALPLGLDGEGTLPAVWSALLLVAAAWATGQLSRRVGSARPAALAVAVLFAFMALDELLALHEKLEVVFSASWLVLYAPVIALGGLGWLVVLLRLRDVRPAALAWAAGAVCWGMAQVIEWYQYDRTVLVHRWTILPEEVLEMTGSLLFLVAARLGAQQLGAAARQGLPSAR